MSDLAVLTRLDPRTVADLDEDEFRALIRSVEQRERSQAWGNLHEAMASAVEALWTIIARLDAGIPTVQVQKTRKPKDYGRYPRPSWVQGVKPKEIVFKSVGDAVRQMKGGSGGS